MRKKKKQFAKTAMAARNSSVRGKIEEEEGMKTAMAASKVVWVLEGF